MKKRFTIVAVCAAILSSAMCCFAQNEIIAIAHYYPTCGLSDTEFRFNAGADVVIDTGNCLMQLNIYTVDGAYNIGTVKLSGGIQLPVKIILGSGAWKGIDIPHPPAAVNWDGLDIITGGLEQWIWLEGHISGNLTNTVKAGHIYGLYINGNVQAGIQSSESGGFWVTAGSVASTGNVTALNNDIGKIETTTGDLAGRIFASGNIGDVIVTGSILNRASGPHICAGGDINQIEVTGSIGESSKPVTINAGGIIKYINVPSGDLHANITATKLERSFGVPNEPCVDVGGNVADTTITLTDSIVTTSPSLRAILSQPPLSRCSIWLTALNSSSKRMPTTQQSAAACSEKCTLLACSANSASFKSSVASAG